MPLLFKSYTRTYEKAPASRYLIDFIATSRKRNTRPFSGEDSHPLEIKHLSPI